MHVSDSILNDLKKGDIKALERIYHAYSGRVYNFIFYMLKDSSLSKDFSQDVFLHIWEKRANIDINSNFEGYLFKITKNLVYQHFRRDILKQNYLNQLNEGEPIKTFSPDENIDNKLLEQHILKLIEGLPKSRKQIFLLYWKSEMNYKEIAKELSISEKTVATQIQRSLQFLREKLGVIVLLTILSDFPNII